MVVRCSSLVSTDDASMTCNSTVGHFPPQILPVTGSLRGRSRGRCANWEHAESMEAMLTYLCVWEEACMRVRGEMCKDRTVT